MPKQKLVLFYTFVILTIVTSVFPQSPKRSDVPDKHKWNLADVYTSVTDWKADLSKIENSISAFTAYKGKLGSNSQTFLDALNSYFGMLKIFYKSSTYAGNVSNEDVNISENQALLQQLSSVGTKFGETASFFEPEILSLPKETIEKFFKEKPELNIYSVYVDNIQRLRPHTLSEPEEKMLASFGLIAGNQNTVYSLFADGEKPNPMITLSDGKEVELSPSTFTGIRTVENRNDRKKVFDAFFNSYGDFKNTLGANLVGKVKKDWVFAKNRKYESTIESSLNGDNLPVSVYTTRFTNYYLDSIKIKLIVVNSKKADEEATTYCRAWIKVVKNDSVINQVYFNNLDSTKNCTSLFLPEPQPSADFFMMVKYGDNDGRTIVIDKRGKIFNMIGGRYFITKDNRFLFSPWVSLEKGLAVFDFKTGRVVFNNNDLGVELADWYFQDGRYFSLDQESEIEEDDEESDT